MIASLKNPVACMAARLLSILEPCDEKLQIQVPY